MLRHILPVLSKGGDEHSAALKSSIAIETRRPELLLLNIHNAPLNVRHASQKMNKKPRFLTKVLGGAPPPSSATNQSFDTSNLQSPQLRPSASQNTKYSA